VPGRGSGRSRVAWCARNDRQTSCGRGRCPPCLLSPRGRPRISPSKQTAVPAGGRPRQATPAGNASRRRHRRPPTRPGPTSGPTNGWWTSYTSDTRPIPARSTGPGGTSSPTITHGRLSRVRRPGRAQARPVLRRVPARRNPAWPSRGRPSRGRLSRGRPSRGRPSRGRPSQDRPSQDRPSQRGQPPGPGTARGCARVRSRAKHREPPGPELLRRPWTARALRRRHLAGRLRSARRPVVQHAAAQLPVVQLPVVQLPAGRAAAQLPEARTMPPAPKRTSPR
jgi:hypothetical protein